MFGFKKNQPQPVEPEVPVEVVEEPKEPEFVKADKTFIGEGITMVGDFSGKDPIVIKGTLKGNIVSDNNILVEQGGKFLGDSNANSLDVEGYVEGNMNLRDETTLLRTGKMNGLLETARLHAADGSVFEGTLKLNTKAPAPLIEEEIAEELPSEISEEYSEEIAEDAVPEDDKPRARAIPV